jgi:branched-subunit amino acid aminotransferase/4-amino-4-deoxychorismate lyase
VTYEYSLPFGGLPTNFRIEAAALFDLLAGGALGGRGMARAVQCEGDRLLTCGDATLFAIRGRVLFTPSVADGGLESVERGLVMEAATKARLIVREEPILHSALKDYDELFFADATGITSLAECDGAKFMSIIAPKIIIT